MSEDLREPLSFLEKIPPRDKEIILLAPVYFYGKYMRRNINVEGFEPNVPDWNDDDPISILRAGFSIHRQINADFEGNAVGAISEALSNHSMRRKLFPHLDNEEIENICWKLDEIFENQESCAQCKSRSYYEAETPEEFAIDTAADLLPLQGGLGISWFGHKISFKDRAAIIKAIIREKTSGKIRKLLLTGENSIK